MDKRAIQPAGVIDSTAIGYSQAIEVDGTLCLSGQVGWDENFELAGDDIESQARQAFENVETILTDAGRPLDDVVKVTSYLVEPQPKLETYLDVFGEVFETEPYPCHTILGVESLAREAFLVEVEVQVAER